MLALFIVVLLNINSYAAVGANDGSAFVTKAEFDALVNTFNDQMDTYQSGMNAKIDGAIANYLAGLSGLSMKQVEPLNAPEKGVWSAVTANSNYAIDWIEGVSKFECMAVQANQNNYGAKSSNIMIKLINNQSQDYYFEHRVKNTFVVDSITYGIYSGYYKSKYSFICYASQLWGNGATDDFKGGSIQDAVFGNVGVTFKYMLGGAHKFTFNCNQGLIARDVTEQQLRELIVCPTNDPKQLFVHDEIIKNNGNYNPDKNIVPSNSVNLSTVFKDNGSKGCYNTVESSFAPTLTGTVENAPFYGFDQNLKNYSYLLSDSYTSIIDELINKSGAQTITKGTNKYLRVTNGLPLLKCNAGDEVTVPLKFDKINGEYKNIDIWLKCKAFKSDENVKTSTDTNIIKATNVTNMIPSAYTNAITCDCITGNGTGTLKFTMPIDGYVFMKWSVAGNEGNGGGVFYPQTMTVTTQN